jgi:hypothetical protein
MSLTKLGSIVGKGRASSFAKSSRLTQARDLSIDEPIQWYIRAIVYPVWWTILLFGWIGDKMHGDK